MPNYELCTYCKHQQTKKRKRVKKLICGVTGQEPDYINECENFHLKTSLLHQIEQAHQFYTSTFDRKSGIPTLSLGFFKEICQTMGKQVVFMFALLENKHVACAITLKSDDALFGRFWGCNQDFHSLHFETCFYQGIEYCIENKLQRFEPGAQGEHKITRGFLPTKTWSAHWMNDSQFQQAIYTFCQREEVAMHDQCKELLSLSPYRLDA